MARASSATTFGRRAARDDPDVDADAARQILEPLDGRDLRRQLVNGARALARIEAGVRGDAVHGELELAAALARGLQRAARQRRLEHEHGAPTAAPPPRSSRATSRCRSLRRSSTASSTGGCGVPVARSAVDRGERQRDARLHVEDARAVQPVAVAPQRHALERADRPHRIEVAEQQHRRPRRRRSAARRWSPRSRCGSTSDVRAGRRAASPPARAPQRSTAALSVLGDSSRTSVSIVCEQCRRDALRSSRAGGSCSPVAATFRSGVHGPIIWACCWCTCWSSRMLRADAAAVPEGRAAAKPPPPPAPPPRRSAAAARAARPAGAGARRRPDRSDARRADLSRRRVRRRPTTPAGASATTCSAPTPTFVEIVNYYKTVLKQKGELVYEEPGDPPVRHRASSGKRRWRFRRA